MMLRYDGMRYAATPRAYEMPFATLAAAACYAMPRLRARWRVYARVHDAVMFVTQ